MLKVGNIVKIGKKGTKHIIEFKNGDIIKVKTKRSILPLLILIKYQSSKVCDLQNYKYLMTRNIIENVIDDKTILRNDYKDKYKPYNDLISESGFSFIKKIENDDKTITYVLDVKDHDKLLEERKEQNDLAKKIYLKQNKICNMCFKSFDLKDGNIGYVKPLARGGIDDESNMEMLCSSCYEKKKSTCKKCIEICAKDTCPLWQRLDIENISPLYISSLQVKAKATNKE